MTHPEPAPGGADDGRPDALPLIPAAAEPVEASAHAGRDTIPESGVGADARRGWRGKPGPRRRRAGPGAAGAALNGDTDADTVHDPSAAPPPRRANAAFMRSHPLHRLSLGFGAGLVPFAPGLAGSLLGWLSFTVLRPHLRAAHWLVLIAAALVLGVAATGFTARALGGERPRAIVWDRIIAVWIVMLFVTPAGFGAQLAAFVLYRVIDRVRPPPVRHLDRRLKGGTGIMADDLVAAFATLFVVAMWHALFTPAR